MKLGAARRALALAFAQRTITTLASGRARKRLEDRRDGKSAAQFALTLRTERTKARAARLTHVPALLTTCSKERGEERRTEFLESSAEIGAAVHRPGDARPGQVALSSQRWRERVFRTLKARVTHANSRPRSSRRGRPPPPPLQRCHLDCILVFWVSPSRLAQLLQQVGAEEEQRGSHRR